MSKIICIGLSDLTDNKMIEVIEAINEETNGDYNLEGSHEIWIQLKITEEEIEIS